MNSRKTNRLVVILNIISIISIFILHLFEDYLAYPGMIIGKSINSGFSSYIITLLTENTDWILIFFNIIIGVLNIVCAIQNKENKKLFFWLLAFGICEIYAGYNMGLLFYNSIVFFCASLFLCILSPLILSIKNIIFIKRNQPKRIQIISYFVVIIYVILMLFRIVEPYWNIIALIMQLIYVHYQDKSIEESTSRKRVNFILYYFMQLITILSFLIIMVYSLLVIKINDITWEKELSELYNEISTLEGSTKEEVYIPVDKNQKYGFINENGEEKIPCEFDRVSCFNEIEINNKKFYVALVKQDNIYYILSKENNKLEIKNNLQSYLKNLSDNTKELFIKSFNKEGDYKCGYIEILETYFYHLIRKEGSVIPQYLSFDDIDNTVTLNEKNSKFTYKNKNYSMLLEPIYDDTDDNIDEDIYAYGGYNSYENVKFKVTITKQNGEQQSDIVYLPKLYEDNNEIYLSTFTNGFIEFESENHSKKGWYDNNGNQTTIPNKYDIKEIRNNKIILFKEIDGITNEYYVFDTDGNQLLKTSAIDIYDNMYLVKKQNKKMVLLDNDFKEISNLYDKIITTFSIDNDPRFSSYY